MLSTDVLYLYYNTLGWKTKTKKDSLFYTEERKIDSPETLALSEELRGHTPEANKFHTFHR